ncbi:MAG: NUDIX domain-containing protein [Ilumatobacteraceae bacterium]
MADTTPPDDVPVRPAATVMLVRDSDAGPEVFMLRRTTSAVFASGMYVYPGGKVDTADGEGEDAYLVAAVRECYEEAGVLLVEEPDGSLIADGHPALVHREAVHDGTVNIHALCDEHGLKMATDRMAYVAHWITPKGESPRRFDTRFFLAVAPPDQTSVHDDTETIASEWVRPADALQRSRDGQMGLMPPTTATLEFLAAFDTADDALAAGREIGTPPLILPKVRFSDDGKIRGVAMPGDADYDSLD